MGVNRAWNVHEEFPAQGGAVRPPNSWSRASALLPHWTATNIVLKEASFGRTDPHGKPEPSSDGSFQSQSVISPAVFQQRTEPGPHDKSFLLVRSATSLELRGQYGWFVHAVAKPRGTHVEPTPTYGNAGLHVEAKNTRLALGR